MTVLYSTGTINSLLGTSSLKTIFTNCTIDMYSGAQPATADSAITGTLLGSVTISGGAFVHGVATNGLNFGTPVLTVLAKAVAEIWQFKGVAVGTLGWFRVKANPADNDAASTTLARIDGSVGITSGDLRVSTVTTAVNGIITIDSFTITGS